MGRRATRRRPSQGAEKTARMSRATAAPTPFQKTSATPQGSLAATHPPREAEKSPWLARPRTPPAERRGRVGEGPVPASRSPPRVHRNRPQKTRNLGVAPSSRDHQVSFKTCWRCTTKSLPWITFLPLQTVRLSSWEWNDLLGGRTRPSTQTKASRARFPGSCFERVTYGCGESMADWM